MNELMSDGGDCRTAPATPGLLINELLGLAQIWKQLGQGRILTWDRCTFDLLGATLATFNHLKVPP